jgi:hypothetical protein
MTCKRNNNQLRSVELQKFSENAAQLLLQRGKLVEFFASLGYPVEPHGEGFRGMCPVCLSAFCFIGLNGKHHRVYWKCFDSRCDSNQGKAGFCRNLLGLVRGQVEGNGLGTAIEAIAEFLGYRGRSWDLTNGKFARSSSAGPTPGRSPASLP